MRIKIIAACVITISLTMVIPGRVYAQEGASGTEHPGAALMAEHCTKCHNLDEVLRLRQTRVQWEDTVYSMVARGAPVYINEAEQIVDYLSGAFGPDATK